MSFRGRALIINSLVASSLWHRLSVLEPPGGILERIQVRMINFFWDKLHWVPRAVLYLPKEEGGQGIVDLKSRKATFRLQFVQKFLYKSDVLWNGLTSCLLSKVGGWGFGKNLFWTDCNKLDFGFISPFYESVRKAWCVVQIKRSLSCKSLKWFLEEPLINGARLDICDDTTPWLRQVLTNAKVVKMKSLIEVAGRTLDNNIAFAQKMDIRSTRTIYLLLRK